MPKLVIDARPLTANPKGVGRYAYHLCEQLSRQLPANWDMLLIVCNENLPVFDKDFRGTFITIPVSSDLIASHFTIPKKIKELKADLLLKINETAGWNYGIPFITICHDITDLITKAQVAQGLKRSILSKVIYKIKNISEIKGLKASEFVVCNSVFIKEAVKSYYNIATDKTPVAYCAIDLRFYLSPNVDKIAVKRKYGIDQFILTFATGDLRENFMRLPQIIASLKKSENFVPFIIAGVKKDAAYFLQLKEEFDQLSLIEGSDYIIETFLTEERFDDLLGLYTTADFYLELSLHEGFGMQLAEAMACGTTCITTKGGALSEVGDQYALFIENPTDNEHICQVIEKAYSKKMEGRNNEMQIEYIKRFNWGKTGKTVVDTLLKMESKY